MDENEIYDILGVTPPASEASGDAGPEGEPQDNDSAQPGGTGEAEVPEAGQEEETPPESGEELPAQQEADTGKQQEQTPAEPDMEAKWQAIAAQAAARAVEEERARNKAQWDAFFASAGLKNNLEGGKPITSLEEFQAWKAKYDRMKLEQDLKDGKLTPEAFEAAVRAEVEKVAGVVSVGRDDSARRPTNAQAGTGGAPGSLHPTDRAAPGPQVTQAQIDAELAEIHRLDGSVNGLADILKMETGGAFQEAVRRGHSFLDAFKLANFDRLQTARQAEAAQRAAQAARNSARSKEHLRSSDSKGGGNVAVPGDVMEMYRMMMPGKSEAEITAHYNRMLKEMKS